jgi:hypothetical protein
MRWIPFVARAVVSITRRGETKHCRLVLNYSVFERSGYRFALRKRVNKLETRATLLPI